MASTRASDRSLFRYRLSPFVGAADDRRLFLLVFAPLLVLYLLTASWSLPVNKDTFTNALTAWNLGTEQSFYLDQHARFVDDETWGWLVPARDSVATQYPPGAALLAAPLYAVWPEDAEPYGGGSPTAESNNGAPDDGLIPPLGPAAIVAATTTAAAIGLLALVFRRVGATAAAALAGAYVAGLATAAWSVASDQLWQHGPAMVWIALGLLLSETTALGSGLAFGAAVLTRPPLALIAAGTGLARGFTERKLRPLVLIGTGAMFGLVLFVTYNQWIFGSPSLSAGYGSSFQDRVLHGGSTSYVENLLGALFSVDRGLLVYSPLLVLLIPGLRTAWKTAPGWVKGSTLGGVAYLLLQYKANRFSGGFHFLTYRYPLEALTAAAPLLFLSYREWVAPRARMVTLFAIAVGLSIVIHGAAALGIDLI